MKAIYNSVVFLILMKVSMKIQVLSILCNILNCYVTRFMANCGLKILKFIFSVNASSGLWLGALIGLSAILTILKEDASYSEICLVVGLTGIGLVISCVCLYLKLSTEKVVARDFQVIYFLPAIVTSMLYLLIANKGIPIYKLFTNALKFSLVFDLQCDLVTSIASTFIICAVSIKFSCLLINKNRITSERDMGLKRGKFRNMGRSPNVVHFPPLLYDRRSDSGDAWLRLIPNVCGDKFAITISLTADS